MPKEGFLRPLVEKLDGVLGMESAQANRVISVSGVARAKADASRRRSGLITTASAKRAAIRSVPVKRALHMHVFLHPA